MNLIRKATETQLTFLRNSGASFKVILADGEVIVHDPNNLIDPQAKKKKSRGPSRNAGVLPGEPTAYAVPFIKNLQPGQAVDVPNKYHKDTMRSVLCNAGRRMFGTGNYLTEQPLGKDYTTFLRVN